MQCRWAWLVAVFAAPPVCPSPAAGQEVPPAQVAQEDIYSIRALPPQEAAAELAEAPTRRLEFPFLKDRGVATYGWVEAGIGDLADRNWQGQMNQLYLVNERVIDTSRF